MRETALALESVLADAARLARGKDLTVLALLLDMARAEAERAARLPLDETTDRLA